MPNSVDHCLIEWIDEIVNRMRRCVRRDDLGQMPQPGSIAIDLRLLDVDREATIPSHDHQHHQVYGLRECGFPDRQLVCQCLLENLF